MLELLGRHEVFAALSKNELNSLLPIIKRMDYEEGELVFGVDEKPKFLFYIEKGKFTLQLANSQQKAMKKGQLFGEIGVINGDFRSGSVYAAEPATVIAICGSRLFNEAFVAPAVALKIVRALSKRITNHLRSKEQVSTKEIIEQGENEYVEFKSTLRKNLHTNKFDSAVEHAVLKTLAGFMNSNGGLLAIGVADDGSILGLEKDDFPNNDKMLLHLTNLTKTRIGVVHLKYLHFSFEKIEGKDILRIDCNPANIPAYLKDHNVEHFFIRTGPATTSLGLSKVYSYIRDRFVQQGDR